MEKYEDIQENIKDDIHKVGQTTQERLAGMRKKADLSDIILEKEHSSHDKKKKLLLGAASLVLIFLIVLIISKMLNDSSTQTVKSDVNTTTNSEIQKVAQSTSEIIVAPVKDSIKATTNGVVTSNKPTATIAKANTQNDTDLKFEEMVRKLKEQDAKENASETPTTDVITPKKTETTVKKVAEKLQPKTTTPKKSSNIKITSTPTTKPKSVTKKPTTTNVKVPSFKEFSVGKSGYYIQVGATTRPQPSRTLVNKIKSNGFSYITHSIRVKGKKFNKILVGPFSSKNAAHNKMGMVKATINPQAFLYHLR